MKVHTALIIGLVAIMTPSVLTDTSGSQAPKRGHLIFGLEDNCARIESACVARLGRIPETRSVLAADELAAIRFLGAHRSYGLQVTGSLLRVVHMRRAKPGFGVRVRFATAGTLFHPELLSEYPAARALIRIGLPSVHAIISVLDTSLSKDQLKIYSGIILEVLGAEHARPFVEIERKTVPGKRQNYDALLRAIDKTRTEWLSSREFDVRMPAGRATPKQNAKWAKPPTTMPAR